ncbi:MAG: N-acetylmuramoyl-L-alanine amidase [Bacteroidia bacterium]|nr:N-acetylmuramoyl-L-alanine amidase [Bacteroidia bacterium]
MSTYERIANVEQAFRNSGDGKYRLETRRIGIPGENTDIEVVACTRIDGFSGYFSPESVAKERIVLHYTVGNLRSDIYSLTDPARGKVSVAYVVARDGTIYQLFDPACWSYHLGKGALGGNEAESRKTIGIELSNYGGLTLQGNQLMTAYSSATHPDPYCDLTQQTLYQQVSYRGAQYFATFTDAQYNSLSQLLRFLTAAFLIPRDFLPESIRYTQTDKVLTHRGIVSHVNYRSDKFDIGPAFAWDRVITAAQAAPTLPDASSAAFSTRGGLSIVEEPHDDELEEQPVSKPLFAI